MPKKIVNTGEIVHRIVHTCRYNLDRIKVDCAIVHSKSIISPHTQGNSMKNNDHNRKRLTMKTKRIAVWFPEDTEILDKLETLTKLYESEMPIRGVKIFQYAAIIAAVEEAIMRRAVKERQ